MLDKVPVTPFAGACWLSVTVQRADVLEFSEEALHCSAATLIWVAGASREMLVEELEPLSDAVRVAVWLAAMVPAAAVKVADEAPCETLTEPGTVRTPEAEFAIATVTPPVTAALFRVTVQAVDAFELSEPAAHCSELTAFGATRRRLAVALEPLRDAVMVAF